MLYRGYVKCICLMADSPYSLQHQNQWKQQQNKNTRIAATRYTRNQKIKILYCKKQKLKELLYNIHLELAKCWNVTWFYIQTATNAQLGKMIDFLYQKINKKLDALQKRKSHNENNKETTKHTFHTRLKNIQVSPSLNKYTLHNRYITIVHLLIRVWG